MFTPIWSIMWEVGGSPTFFLGCNPNILLTCIKATGARSYIPTTSYLWMMKPTTSITAMINPIGETGFLHHGSITSPAWPTLSTSGWRVSVSGGTDGAVWVPYPQQAQRKAQTWVLLPVCFRTIWKWKHVKKNSETMSRGRHEKRRGHCPRKFWQIAEIVCFKRLIFLSYAS